MSVISGLFAWSTSGNLYKIIVELYLSFPKSIYALNSE